MKRSKFKIEKYGGEIGEDGKLRTSLYIQDKNMNKNAAIILITIDKEYLDNSNIIVNGNKIEISYE